MRLRALSASLVALGLLAGCSATDPARESARSDLEAANRVLMAQAVRPASIELPSLGVSSTLYPTGLDDTGAVEVPPVTQPEQASYFAGAAAPGEPGAALVLAHVNGPDAEGTPGAVDGLFARLTELVAGDRVTITRTDGTVLVFEVYTVMEVSKDAFPWDRVLSPVTGPELRLVTCTGTVVGGSYDNNLVVFAKQI